MSGQRPLGTKNPTGYAAERQEKKDQNMLCNVNPEIAPRKMKMMMASPFSSSIP